MDTTVTSSIMSSDGSLGIKEASISSINWPITCLLIDSSVMLLFYLLTYLLQTDKVPTRQPPSFVRLL